MHLIWTILIGLVAGVIAKFMTPRGDRRSLLATAALGVGGSLAATLIGQAVGLYTSGQSAGFIGAVVGAVLLLGAYQLAAKR